MIKIAMAQMEVIPGRPDLNCKSMLSMISQGRDQQAELIIFPEMAIPGYLLGDTWEQTAFLRDCEEYGRQVIAASNGLCIIFGNVGVDWQKKGDDGRIRKYNACFIAQNGELQGGNEFPYPFRIKTLHPNYREFEDSRHFFSLRKLAQAENRRVGELLQPVVLELAGQQVRLGCILCEDGWYDDYDVNPIALLKENGPIDLFVNISSSPFTLGKNSKRNRVFSQQAKETNTPLVYVSNVGLQNNGKTVYTFDGSSTTYDCHGRIISQCQPFQASLQLFDIDLASGGQNLPAHRVPDDLGIDRIALALEYGTDKFLQLIGMHKVVIGVSGGIDSAVAAALYAHVLGPDKVLLANLPSIHNSRTTKNLAQRLSQNLGCHYTVIPIQDSVNHTISQLAESPITHLETGQQNFLSISPFVVENIQARDRSARVLAGLAAALGGGFTCNANKSELTVGYSTLYGDQAGFLATLGDLWKHQVYALGEYLNRHIYGAEIIPREIFNIVPSAELSPEQAVDQGKGDPLTYPYHDYLFRAFMEWWNRATPEDILTWYAQGELEMRLGCEVGVVSRLFARPADFIVDLEHWWKLYTGMGVAKRIQAPPVLAVTRRAYGFDHREAQNPIHFTLKYLKLKEQLLSTTNF